MPTEIFDPTRTSPDAEFSEFTVLSDAGVKSYMYAQADGAISVGAVCIIDTDGTAIEGTATLAPTHSVALSVWLRPPSLMTDYGWLQVDGPCAAIQSDGALSVGETIWFGSTAGALSDTNTGDCQIYGLKVDALSAAGNGTGFLTRPTVQGDV